MKRKNRLHGFTMLEALLSLLILSIVIGATFALLNMVNKQMYVLQYENVAEMEYVTFDNRLRNDINESVEFLFKDRKLVLTKYNLESVEYSFKNDYLLRKSKSIIDTLRVKTEQISLEKEDYRLKITTQLLRKKISGYYFLKDNQSNDINKKYFD